VTATIIPMATSRPRHWASLAPRYKLNKRNTGLFPSTARAPSVHRVDLESAVDDHPPARQHLCQGPPEGRGMLVAAMQPPACQRCRGRVGEGASRVGGADRRRRARFMLRAGAGQPNGTGTTRGAGPGKSFDDGLEQMFEDTMEETMEAMVRGAGRQFPRGRFLLAPVPGAGRLLPADHCDRLGGGPA